MVFYKCEKCNKEFNQKCNYISHINKKNSCVNTNEEKNIIIYKCEKCNKEFKKKSNYITHINRKLSCNGINLENNKLLLKIKELESKLLTIETEKTFFQNEIIKIKEDKDIFKITEEKDVIKRENIKLKELLNYKDAVIKNIIDNNKKNDIKIKLVQEYIYIIRECDFVRLNEDIYKIGRTAKNNPEDRFQKYRKGTEIIGFFKVNNSIDCENKIIQCFSNHTNIKKMSEYGKEYFQGNRNELLNEILEIVKNYNIYILA
jgi:uncharacterized C2H2 Zn-finger protein